MPLYVHLMAGAIGLWAFSMGLALFAPGHLALALERRRALWTALGRGPQALRCFLQRGEVPQEEMALYRGLWALVGATGGLALLSPLAGFPLVASLALGGGAGFLFPDLYLGWRLKKRQEQALEELPEVASLLGLLLPRNLYNALSAIARLRQGLIPAAIGQALRLHSLGDPLLPSLERSLAPLRLGQVGDFLDLLRALEGSPGYSRELLRRYQERLAQEGRDRALRAIKRTETKMSAMLTFCFALDVLLLLVVPGFLSFTDIFGGGLGF